MAADRPGSLPRQPRTSALRIPRFLRPNDQRAVGPLLALGLALLAAAWALRGGPAGRLVDAERLPQRENRFQVDVNRAGAAELAAIPEVGPALAGRIVAYRQQVGGIRRPEQLLEVRGIGPKTLEAIRPFLAPIEAPPER